MVIIPLGKHAIPEIICYDTVLYYTVPRSVVFSLFTYGVNAANSLLSLSTVDPFLLVKIVFRSNSFLLTATVRKLNSVCTVLYSISYSHEILSQ